MQYSCVYDTHLGQRTDRVTGVISFQAVNFSDGNKATVIASVVSDSTRTCGNSYHIITHLNHHLALAFVCIIYPTILLSTSSNFLLFTHPSIEHYTGTQDYE